MNTHINVEQANKLWGSFVERCLDGAIEYWAGNVGRNADGSLCLHSGLELPKTVIASEDFYVQLRKQCFDLRPYRVKDRDQLWHALECGELPYEMADYIAQTIIVGDVVFE